MGHGQTVVSDGNMPNFSLLFCLQSGIIQAVLPSGSGTKSRVMELIDIDVIRLEHAKALLQVLPHPLRRYRGGLSGNVNFIPHAGKGGTYLLLTVGVGPGGVKIIHPSVVGPAEQGYCLCLGNPLDGQAAKGLLLGHDAGAAQSNRCHKQSLLTGSFPIFN